MRSRVARRQKFSEIQTGYELNQYGWFSVVLPEGRTNLVKNPSLEKSASGYVAKGGTIARSAEFQSRGAVSLKVTPTAGVNDGFYYDDPSHDLRVSENTLCWQSFDFKADGGRKYKAYMARQFSGTQLGAAYPFTATGNPQRIEFPYREGDNTRVDNLSAYWKLSEATGATRLDSFGTNHLTPLGGANPGPSQTTGIINFGALFTRANSEYLTIADTAALSAGNFDFYGDLTVKLTTKTNLMGIFFKGTADTAAGLEYRLLYSTALDRFQWLVSDGVTATTVTSNAFGAVPTGVFIHITVWHDSVNNVIGIRINDTAQDTAAHTAGSQDTAGNFQVGRTFGGNFFDGVVDEFAFGKKVPTAAEMTQFYNSGFADTYPFLYRRLYVVKDNETNTRPFYVDGLQLEAGDFPTTYLDGDQRGLIPNFVDYYWTGAPHASTSVRVANSADGGRVINLSRLGFRIISVLGLGLGGLNPVMTPLGNGGEFYQGTSITGRDFTLVGEIGNDQLSLDVARQALEDAFGPNRISPQQPIKLRYEPLDECGNSLGRTLEIPCVFKSGMELQRDNLERERLALTFRLYLPFAANDANDQGTPLSYQELSTTYSGFAWQDTNGNWFTENLGGVNVILPLPDGTLALGGGFVNAAGLADADYLVRYNPATRTFTAFNTTPLSAPVYSLALLPDGNVAVGGQFLNAGDANGDYLCKLDLTTGLFSSFNATPLAGGTGVYALALLPDGNLAVGGDFLNAGGFANADYLTKLTLSTGAFSAFNATPLGGQVRALVIDKSFSYLVIGGAFLNAGGANGDYVCRMLISTGAFSQLVTANPLTATSAVFSLGILPSGDYVIGGDLTNHNGIAGYNGTAFYDLGTGIGAGGIAYTIMVKSDGQVVVGGLILGTGSLAFAEGAAIWTGSAWITLDMKVPVGDQARGTAQINGNFFIGTSATGNVVFSDITTIANTGTAPSYPSLSIRGPGRLVSLKNFTNSSAIYFDITLMNGEEATLTFKQSGATFTSNLRGNIAGTILPGSNTNFTLDKGSNNISAFIIYTAAEQNDGGNQISFNSFTPLQGVSVLNSDNGRLYANIVNLGGANRRVDFYSDSARTQLVAQTGTYAATGSQAVTQANSSGITGVISIDTVGAADSDIIFDFPVMTMQWSPAFTSLSSAVLPRLF